MGRKLYLRGIFTMIKLKSFIATILCGLSTFSIVPNTDYSSHIPRDHNTITRMAWQKTGNSLRTSIGKVGARIVTTKIIKQKTYTE